MRIAVSSDMDEPVARLVAAAGLRLNSEPPFKEILDARFAGAASTDGVDRANVGHLAEIR